MSFQIRRIVLSKQPIKHKLQTNILENTKVKATFVKHIGPLTYIIALYESH